MSNTSDSAEKDAGDEREGSLHPGNSLNDLTGKEWIKATKSWLICDSRRFHQNRDTELHPARYPEELVAEFLRFFTKRGGWVLDPFCGSGATLVAALEEERNGIGLDVNRHYVDLSVERLEALPGKTEAAASVVHADARHVAQSQAWEGVDGVPRGDDGLPRFDFVMTSPPYWDMLRKSRGGVESTHQQRAARGLDTDYGGRDGDLGTVEDYEEFIEQLGVVFDGCAGLLKPLKYMVVVVQNVRVPEGYVRPLAWDLARRISRTLSFQGERIWCQDSKQLGIWGYPTTFVPNYHHHYCLIFRREQE